MPLRGSIGAHAHFSSRQRHAPGMALAFATSCRSLGGQAHRCIIFTLDNGQTIKICSICM
ncbi:hypothetical protein KU74_17850 [Pectobacterium brasiliense]|uniref:Uncharacterized protein n=1 Tax=Pectobacterium brasiliense TaxID=180957 RepID=A0A0M2EWZ9_9GAMM|nr:hypothetical protein KU74_17850 [Pectobacterium brasiliense]